MSKNLDNNQNAPACVYYRDDFDFLMRMLNAVATSKGWRVVKNA